MLGQFFCKIKTPFFYFEKMVVETSPTPPASCSPEYCMIVLIILDCQNYVNEKILLFVVITKIDK